MRRKEKAFVALVVAATVICGCSANGTGTESDDGKDKTMDLQILATSDLHGKFVPWDYALNEESTSGSVAQVATAVKGLRTENTILVDGILQI